MKHAQLWKRILNEGVHPRHTGEDDALQRAIVTATIIVDTRSCGRDLLVEDAKRIAFPFPSLWIEFPEWKYAAAGVHVTSHRTDSGTDATFLLVTAFEYSPPVFLGGYACKFDERGDMVLDSRRYLISEATYGLEEFRVAGKAAQGFACDTLSLLGCKNVSLNPQHLEPQQVRRASRRFGGDSTSYRYHTLIVRPPGAKHDSPGIDIGTMPRHVCRGHFAEYGPEFGKGLLFGKYAGRFFVPPCLKGNAKNGTVAKDYEIGASLAN